MNDSAQGDLDAWGLSASPADLAGEVIGRVAREHGVTMPRDDPVMLVVQAFDGLLERRLSTLIAPVDAELHRLQHDAAKRLQEAAQAASGQVQADTYRAALEAHRRAIEAHLAGHRDFLTALVGEIGKRSAAAQARQAAKVHPAWRWAAVTGVSALAGAAIGAALTWWWVWARYGS